MYVDVELSTINRVPGSPDEVVDTINQKMPIGKVRESSAPPPGSCRPLARQFPLLSSRCLVSPHPSLSQDHTPDGTALRFCVSCSRLPPHKVPIMLRSGYCSLTSHNQAELQRLGECPYDQGGYFVINGSEKVLIAQEKMSTNHVYVFQKKQPSKYSFTAEVRSLLEASARAASSCMLRILNKGAGKGTGGTIRVTIPYIRQDIPIIVLFRALGLVADKDILEHIVYDLTDVAMMDLLRPSLEEASVIQSQEVALDFIGKRGNVVGATKEKRIQYAKDILQKELLPHVGIEERCEKAKARVPSPPTCASTRICAAVTLTAPFPCPPGFMTSAQCDLTRDGLSRRPPSRLSIWGIWSTGCLCARWAEGRRTIGAD